MSNVKETSLEKAQKLIQQANEVKCKKAASEIEAILKKHNVQITFVAQIGQSNLPLNAIVACPVGINIVPNP